MVSNGTLGCRFPECGMKIDINDCMTVWDRVNTETTGGRKNKKSRKGRKGKKLTKKRKTRRN